MERLDAAVAEVDWTGFRATPFGPLPALGASLGFQDGAVWVKDDTANVGGSHKARHLMGILLHLEVVEALGWGTAPRLAIASCGNAALAAAVVARAAERPLRVFIPTSADPVVVTKLDALGADIRECERVRGESGDPAFLRFEEDVAAGALPFCVQGPANGLTLEGGQTLGWEMGAVLRREGVVLDHLVVQVGGGALASACVRAFEQMVALGVLPHMPAIHTVQTSGGYPLARAFERVRVRAAEHGAEEALRHAASHRSEYMWPWETEPKSIAHGILDDETYDWHRVVAGMLATSGEAVVVSEETLAHAHRLARVIAEIPASATGTSGLAGLVELRRTGRIRPDERVAVLLTGVERTGPDT
ncbi:MAG: pyridoxal-phosphate dependent enzyme [Deltaproteobacteria bacterium]|nr:pyridoxal-phosphate dependent enzyme [Deltaproteobacteria bacterium]